MGIGAIGVRLVGLSPITVPRRKQTPAEFGDDI
jgi:hypothetical protein